MSCAVGISTAYMRKLFIQVHGKSPKEVFTEITMARARHLLLRPDLSKKEVAVKCGFNAFSQFYRAFTQHVGVTPSEWVLGKNYGSGNSLNVEVPANNDEG